MCLRACWLWVWKSSLLLSAAKCLLSSPLFWESLSWPREPSRGRSRFFYLHIQELLWLFNLNSSYFLCFFFFLILFKWSIIALPYCAGFCHISEWISHRDTLNLSLQNPPSHLLLISALGSHRSVGLSSLSHSKFPLASILYGKRLFHTLHILVSQATHLSSSLCHRSVYVCSPLLPCK